MPFLFGPKGTGKTTLMSAFIKHHLQPEGVVWLEENEWFDDMRSNMNGMNIPTPNIRMARVLCVDDWCKARPSEWTREQWFNAVNKVYRNNGLLIATSNVSRPSDLKGSVCEYTYDRLKQMLVPVPVLGESLRGK